MKILIYLSHPAQYHFFKNFVKKIRNNDNEVFYIIRSKDILENLLKSDDEKHINISSKVRSNSKISIFWALLKRDFKLFAIVKNLKPHIMLGTDASISHVGKLLRIPVITTLEDDYFVIKNLAKLTFPFTSHIFTPKNCDVGPWENKKIGYDGYMKLAYLHPNYFKIKDSPQVQNIQKKQILIRTSSLNAHHDFGINGFDDELIEKILGKYSAEYDIKISSESPLNSTFLEYKIQIEPTEMHDFLSKTHLLISDSQSMSVEAAMLGIPSIRFSDFSGKISVLEELENKYNLTFGIKTSNREQLFVKINELLSLKNLSEIFQKRKLDMLNDKIDVTAYLVWIVENYPKSIIRIKEDPNFQYDFK